MSGNTRFSESDLEKMGLKKNEDGSWQKPKTKMEIQATLPIYGNISAIGSAEYIKRTKKFLKKLQELQPPIFTKIKLCLFGEPMPKQSVRQGKNAKTGRAVFFQPEEMKVRVEDYQQQIRKQLPVGFIPFETCVFVRQMHFVFAPLKSFHKEKGKMDAIRNGKKYYKNTRPDLPDNLKKLVNDSMSGLVFKDDGIIVAEDNVKKYYGVGGCIIIELEGY